MSHPEAVRWSEDGRAVDILDQTRLPDAEVRLRIASAEEAAEAIRTLRVRGAPAIGVAAALALAVEMERWTDLPGSEFRARLEQARRLLASTRPTAVNLFWALERMARRAAELPGAPNDAVVRALRAEASAILEEDRAMCRRIGEHGLALLPDGPIGVLTHCNAGALATSGMGTALAPIYLAHAAGRSVHVYVDETRPLLQGARITAWELLRAGVPSTLVVDSVAAFLMQQGRVRLVIVGADRIAANGDVANKIGTYALAVLARHHGIPFYVAAPASTVDLATPTGRDIPIEERDPDEVRRGFGRLTAPGAMPVYAPAFDVTPAELVTAIITDRGVLRPPYAESIRRALAGADAAPHPEPGHVLQER
ncbi:MAG: S-methyl-5-thioribose-1-phosphate isomerase [bacterium]|nr:MAG: S-methyl-5-thioribose-1-phosphate isomerase [bacterium]